MTIIFGTNLSDSLEISLKHMVLVIKALVLMEHNCKQNHEEKLMSEVEFVTYEAGKLVTTSSSFRQRIQRGKNLFV